MTALSIILNIVLILISLVLIAVVLMQQGQRQGLGAIAGGAETFFGKGNVKGMDAKLAKITKIAAVAFIILAIACTIVVSHINTVEAEAELQAALESGEAHMHEDGSIHYGEHVELTDEEIAAIEAGEAHLHDDGTVHVGDHAEEEAVEAPAEETPAEEAAAETAAE